MCIRDSNWGSDLALLVKAANEAGYNGKFFTYYTGVTGTPTALGSTGAGKVYQIAYSHYNMGGQKADAKFPYSPENTGMTLAPVAEYPNYVSSTPTSCQMKRPGA